MAVSPIGMTVESCLFVFVVVVEVVDMMKR